jgi:hypothetical protein
MQTAQDPLVEQAKDPVDGETPQGLTDPNDPILGEAGQGEDTEELESVADEGDGGGGDDGGGDEG